MKNKMQKVLWIMSLMMVFFFITVSAHSRNIKIKKVKLNKKDLPKNWKFGSKLRTISIQARTFYKTPGQYGLLPKPRKKTFQLLTLNGIRIGSILYFEYANTKKIDHVKAMLTGLMWGRNKEPSRYHPEEIYFEKNLLIILSFRLRSKYLKIVESLFKNNKGLKLKKLYEARKISNNDKSISLKLTGSMYLRFLKSPRWVLQYRKGRYSVLDTKMTERGRFMLLMTVYGIDRNRAKTVKRFKRNIYKKAEKALQSCKETVFVMKKIKGAYGEGIYFAALEDKAPGKGFRFLNQGVYFLKRYVLYYTILFNKKNQQDQRQALQMIKNTKIEQR